jgi:predicted ATPase/DNA-binding CsgD family transcriptional regulator
VDTTVSAREAEVLALLGRHLTHAEIAAELVLSVRTVESHVASLRRKLGIPGHRDLVRYAAARQQVPRAPITTLVGRGRECTEVREAVRSTRLVSIIGAGGVGKTTLAQAVADDVASQFPDGAWLVELVGVADPVGVAGAVADACGLTDVPGSRVEDALVRGLAAATALLVLDNCEHVADAVAALIDRLLARCPLLHILVTSRARLVLPFEHTYVLGGLSPAEAIELFTVRARSAGWRSADPSADSGRIAAICARLDGIALALELAAARTPSLGLDGVERGLAVQSELLVGGARASAHHRSMHDTIAWSFELLTPLERDVLCRVCVFVTGFDADAAASVAGFGTVSPDAVTNTLGRLVDQSVVVAPAGGRWHLLEPVRQFGLAAGEDVQTALTRHSDWVTGRAGSLERASGGADREWYAGFDEIADELRAAVVRSPSRELPRLLATLLFRSGRAREAQVRFEQAGALEEAAAVAKCRVDGEAALRLELADRDRCLADDDDDGYLAATARVVDLILRFRGMFAGPIPFADKLLDEVGARHPNAIDVIGLSRADPHDPASARDAIATADREHAAGRLLRESAALDVATGSLVAAARLSEAFALAQRRLDLFSTAVVDPQAVLELKDALRMGVFTAVGVGDLPFALACAERHRRLAALREQRDLAIDEALLPEVLAGRWAQARADADTFAADWDAAGRPAAAGRAVGPAALAMMYALLGDEAARTRWDGVVAALAPGARNAAYDNLFEAIVLADRGDLSSALALIDAPMPTWWGGLFERWRAALVTVCRRHDARGAVLEQVRHALAGQLADGSTI